MRWSTGGSVVVGRVGHFVRVIDVLGFGKKYLAALITKGLVKEPADLYRLTKDDLLSLDRMGDLPAPHEARLQLGLEPQRPAVQREGHVTGALHFRVLAQHVGDGNRAQLLVGHEARRDHQGW